MVGLDCGEQNEYCAEESGLFSVSIREALGVLDQDCEEYFTMFMESYFDGILYEALEVDDAIHLYNLIFIEHYRGNFSPVSNSHIPNQ